VSEGKVVLERDGGVARVWIDRPDVHNAFDAAVIAGLTERVQEASADPAVRVIVLGGRGRSFSAGADLNWMQAAAGLTQAENEADAARLAAMLRALDRSPKATVARVQGAAMGGGLGLLAACDVAIAASRAKFAFSEVKLGIVPAVISPYVVSRIGVARARELFVTGRRFDAAFAERIGLLDRVLPDEAGLDQAIQELSEQLRTSGPEAVRAAKELVREVARLGPDEVDAYTGRVIASRRVSAEGQEGIASFLEKRPPAWAGGAP